MNTDMIQRVDNLWFGVLGRAHRWILFRVAAHFRRRMAREAEAQRRQEALRRLKLNMAAQRPHLN